MVKMAGKDLRSRCMEEGNTKLLSEWDTERNKGLMPENVSAGSHQKVWWQCENGHTWQSEVRVRARGAKCPYCSKRILWVGDNDLATVNPTLAAQWDDTLNGSLTPEMVTPGSHKCIWWKCSEGHVWKAVIYSRTGKDKCGCPVCAGKARRNVKYDLPEKDF